ncbi:putative RNA recognition motif domain, nucleotide-binding alpha-beta plait domain superfamily [Helianthus anomalus]
MDTNGGEPDDGGPWSEVKTRRNTRGRGDGIERTFLVQNISDKVTRSILWRVFRQYGFVSDVYVARKRDSRGKCFGFVRFVGVENMQETLMSMNTVVMFGMKVLVSLARYDKDHRKINYAPDMLGRSVWKPKSGQQDNRNHMVGDNNDGFPSMKNQSSNMGSYAKTSYQDGRSYADLVKGCDRGANSGAKVISVDGKGSLYPLHCIGRSVLGQAKEVMTTCSMRQKIEEEGMNEVGLSFVGGVTYLLTFRDKEYAKLCMELHEGFFKSVFSKFELWNGTDIPFSRLVNLCITGVPFLIRDYSLYDNIGSLFGEVVLKSTFSWEEEDNSGGSVTVVTSTPSKIEEAVVIKWNNKSVVTWVSESSQKWMPVMETSSLSDSQESGSDSESELEEEDEDMEELEEGEFGMNDDNPVNRQEVAGKNGRSGEETMSGDQAVNSNQPVESEKTGDLQESGEAQGVNSFNEEGEELNVHGEVEKAANGTKVNETQVENMGSPNMVSSGGPAYVNTQELGMGPNAGIRDSKTGPNGAIGDTGQAQSQPRGKRSRDIRSPPSIGSTQGPSQRLFSQYNNPHVDPIDLNTPAREKEGNSVDDGPAHRDLPISTANPQVIQGCGGRNLTEGADGAGAIEVDVQNAFTEEVESTVRVGAFIGVDLNGFIPATEQLIADEGVSIGQR